VRVHLVRMEKEALVDHLELLVLLERMVMLASLVVCNLQKETVNLGVILEDLDSQALRVKMVSQVNVVHRVLQDLLEREVGQVQLAQKVPRVLLAPLVPLEAQGCLAYRECPEKEDLLEVLDQKGIRVNLVAKVLMAFLVQEERG
uniref:Uncharacterized protein n=1 Tax=Anser brachyrhynchus TaxID=132585 RepID=A0A8B9CNN3_9AVES